MKDYFLIIALLILSSLNSFSQTTHTSECDIILQNAEKIKKAKLKNIENDSVVYLQKSIEKKVPLEQLNRVTFESGNSVILGTLLGAAAGGLAGYLAGSNIHNFWGDKTYEVEGLLGGILIGGLTGFLITNHKDEVYNFSKLKNEKKVNLINYIIKIHQND